MCRIIFQNIICAFYGYIVIENNWQIYDSQEKLLPKTSSICDSGIAVHQTRNIVTKNQKQRGVRMNRVNFSSFMFTSASNNIATGRGGVSRNSTRLVYLRHPDNLISDIYTNIVVGAPPEPSPAALCSNSCHYPPPQDAAAASRSFSSATLALSQCVLV